MCIRDRVSITNYFQELRGDMEAAYYGFYFMEFAEYYTREYNDETQMLKLLYQTFRALTKKNISNAPVSYTHLCIVFFVGGIQLLCTGIVGQYLSKTYLETKHRPIYILKDSSKEERRSC